MTLTRKLMTSVAILPFLTGLPTLVQADVISEFVGISGDGFVLADVDEGVDPPGIKVVTEAPGTENTSPNGYAPNSVVNCIMANTPPDIACDAAPGSGKRYKTVLTGTGGIDLTFGTVTGAGTGTTEYFNFARTTNNTTARMVGLRMLVGTGTGADFVPAGAAAGVVFDELEPLTGNAIDYEGLGGETTGQNPLQRAFLSDGLFGNGGQDGSVGFFDDQGGGIVLVQSPDNTAIDGTDLFNAFHLATFGDGLLDISMVPDGMYWAESADPDAESALVAWFDPSRDGWIYGALEIDDPATPTDELDARLTELANALGLPDVSALGYLPGGAVPDEVVALMQADGAFAVAEIEDLANLNLNFSLDVGDNAVGAFTLRIVPVFAPVVSVAATPYQFQIASSIDTANVPYLGLDAGYVAMIAQIEALPSDAAQRLAIEQLGYSFLGAYGGLAYELGSQQFNALDSGDAWMMDGNLGGFVSLGGGRSTEAPTLNGAGFDTQTTSVFAGLTTRLGPHATAGLMVGALDGTATIADNRGELGALGYGVSGFVDATFGEGGSIRAMAGIQDLTFDSARDIPLAGLTADAETDGRLTFGGIQAAYMVQRGNVAFGPMGSVAVYNLAVDGFTEGGADIWNMTVEGFDSRYVVASAGLRGQMEVTTANGVFRPYGHVAWATRSGDAFEVGANFADMNVMATPVDERSDSWVDIGVGATTTIARGTNATTMIGGEYRGAFFSDDYESHNLRLFVEMTF